MSVTNLLLKMVNAQCPNCHQAIEASDVERAKQTREFTCSKCGTTIKKNDSPSQEIDKSQATRTSQVQVTDRSGEFRIKIRWLSAASKFAITFAVIWNSFVFGTGYLTFFLNSQHVGLPVMALYGFLGIIGLWSTYSAICELINTTTIILQSDKIQFWTAPLSFSGKKVFIISDIANLSLERVEGGQQNNRRIFNHFINIQFRNGNIERLCRVQDMNEGIYVERILEERLGLTDDPKFDRIAF
jgi:predicted RNA-binding Zn-ribbon protein involved in translation (DUF1610 family)